MATFTYTAKRKIYSAPVLRWDFASDLEGWIGFNGATASWVSGSLIWTHDSGLDPRLQLTLFPESQRFQGAGATLIRAAVRLIAGTNPAWEGRAYYSTADHGYSNDHYKLIPAPADASAWNLLEWNMSALDAGGSDWVDNEVRSLRIDLSHNLVSVGNQWEFDWISVDETHVVGDTYAIETALANLDRERRVRKHEQRADSGASETWYVNADELHMVRTDWIMPADQAIWEEFLASVEGGEAFEFDPTGTIDNPVAPRQVVLVGDSIRPRRVGQTGRVYYDLVMREI